MSDFKRADRIADQIRSELGDIIIKKLKDPRVGFVTITRIQVSDDLKHARVFVSVYGDEKQKKDTLKGLKSAAHFMQGEIGRRLKLKYTPEIAFMLDDSIEKGDKTLDLLREIARERGEEEEG